MQANVMGGDANLDSTKQPREAGWGRFKDQSPCEQCHSTKATLSYGKVNGRFRLLALLCNAILQPRWLKSALFASEV